MSALPRSISKTVTIANIYCIESIGSGIERFPLWKVRDTRSNRSVALQGVHNDAQSVQGRLLLMRYQRLVRCAHPRIAEALEVGVDLGISALGFRVQPPLIFFTRAWLEGPSLKALAGRLKLADVSQLLLETLELIDFLHQKGIVGLLLSSRELVRVNGHWMLASLRTLEDEGLDWLRRYDIESLAPELLEGAEPDARTDLYALGLLLLEALYGQDSEGWRALVERTAPCCPSEQWLEDSLLADDRAALLVLLRDLLAPSPEQRPASAREVLKTLNAGRGQKRPIPTRSEGDRQLGAEPSFDPEVMVAMLPPDATFSKLKECLADVTSHYILERMQRTGGNVAAAAREMDCERFTLYDNCHHLSERAGRQRTGHYVRSSHPRRSPGPAKQPRGEESAQMGSR